MNSTYRLKLNAINYILESDNDFLWDIGIYLFSDFEAKTGTKFFSEDKKNILPLVDKNSGYTTYFDPNIAKESSLSNITYQLQKWKEELAKNS